jgi:7,8-dihydropterin-6-yl-methyl-4-(beta-D-ribofuranosyl)aminobenzene 5'-phosphate synthase
MLKAIQMIKAAKNGSGSGSSPKNSSFQTSNTSDLIIDLHPSRPDYRGFTLGEKIVSLEADPTFQEIEEAGASIHKSDQVHTILDDMFLISGEIPRQTPYETGLKYGMRYDAQDQEWLTDEKIADERFLMCNIKGKSLI